MCYVSTYDFIKDKDIILSPYSLFRAVALQAVYFSIICSRPVQHSTILIVSSIINDILRIYR